VVLDAPFSPYLSDPTFITAAAERFDWPPIDVEVVRVRVSPRTLQDRLRKRGLERDQVKLAHWDEYWAVHGGVPCAWTGVRLSELSNDAQEAETASDVPAPRLTSSSEDAARTEAPDDQRNDHPRRAPGLPHAHVQVVADLQPVV
jgi:hypothetical protein